VHPIVRGLGTTELLEQVVTKAWAIARDDLLERLFISSLASRDQNPFA
jgi:hypothetical protein